MDGINTVEFRYGICAKASELSNPNCPNGLDTIYKKELLERELSPDMVLNAVVLGPDFLISFFGCKLSRLAAVGA